MNKTFALFVIVAVCALVILLFVSVEGRFAGCQCHYIGKCEYDVNGTGYRYYECGNCPAYSGWTYYYNCENVRIPLESVP